MKWRHFILLAVGLSASGLGLQAAPNQMVPKGLGERITIPGLISYQVPNGWDTHYEVNASPQARGPISNGFTPDITFNASNHGSLADFTENFQPELYDSGTALKYMDQTPFVTAAGVKGIRCRSVQTSNSAGATQFSYIFLSPDGQQLEVACACATVDVAVYLKVFDACMKTVVLDKGD